MERQSKRKGGFSLFSSSPVSMARPSGRLFKNSVSTFFSRLSDSVVYSSTRSYGAAALGYGIASVIIYFAKFYAGIGALASYWISGLVLSVLGAVLVCFDEPMCIALQDFPVTDFVIFEFFSVRRMNKREGIKTASPLVGAIVGVIPALITVFVNPVYVILAIVLAVFVIAGFVTPEFPLIFGLLIAPYLSPVPDKGIALTALSLLSFLSFVRKAMLGKRVFNLSVYDVIVALISIILAVGGAINGDMHNALIMISLTLAYIPASNLIANRRLADCAANAVIASSVPIALTGIVNYILSSVGVKFMGESLIFSSLASYAAYLLVAVIFSLAALHESRRSFRRITLGSAVLLEVAALVLTMSAEVLFSALLVLLSYLIIRAPRVRCELVIPILLLPYLCLLLPQNAISGVLEALGMQSYDAIRDEWLAAFRMFLAEPFSGVGIGNYTLRANLPLSLLASLGACVTALLGLTYLLSAVHLSQYSHLLRDSSVSSVARTAQLAVFSSAALGIFFNVFADITLYFLSVCIFAIFSASMRIAKREHDDRLGYFGDQRSDDSYVVDMRIVK